MAKSKKKATRKKAAKKKKVGRPTKYDPKFADLMERYFNIEAGKDVPFENDKGQVKVARVAADLPTFAGFACSIGVHRETLLNWAGLDDNGNPKHPEFFDAYKRAHDHQERILVMNGLKGGYQPSFAIFTAKNILGWRDKNELSTPPEGEGRFEVEVTHRIVDPSKD